MRERAAVLSAARAAYHQGREQSFGQVSLLFPNPYHNFREQPVPTSTIRDILPLARSAEGKQAQYNVSH